MSNSPLQSAASRSFPYSSSKLSSSDALTPRVLTRIAREIRDFVKAPPDGIRLIIENESGVPSSLSEILGEIEGPTGTPYENTFFHLKLVISADFPDAPPQGFFITKIYHPNVDVTSGAICVNTLKKDWNPSVTLSHVFNVIRCLMIIPFPESSLNDEAGKLFMESYEEYARRAKLMAKVHGRPNSYIENGNTQKPPAHSSKSAKENSNDSVTRTSGKTTTQSVLKQSNTSTNTSHVDTDTLTKTSCKPVVFTEKDINTKFIEKSCSAQEKKKKAILRRL